MRAGYLASGLAVMALGVSISIWMNLEIQYIQGLIQISMSESPSDVAQLEVARIRTSLTLAGGLIFAAIGLCILAYGLASKKSERSHLDNVSGGRFP